MVLKEGRRTLSIWRVSLQFGETKMFQADEAEQSHTKRKIDATIGRRPFQSIEGRHVIKSFLGPTYMSTIFST